MKLNNYDLNIKKVGLYVSLIIILLFLYIPIWVGFSSAFKTNLQITGSVGVMLPNPVTFEAMDKAFSTLLPTYLNTFINVVGTLALSGLLSSIGGFYLSKYNFAGNDWVISLIIMGTYVPLVALLLPLVNLMSTLGLWDTHLGLILVYTVWTLPVATVLFKNYYDETLPDSFVSSAKVFGASRFYIYRKIGLPLSWIPFVSAGIFISTQVWNVFLIPLVLTGGAAETRPIASAFVELQAQSTRFGLWNLQMAGAVMMCVPILILYAVFQKYIVRGYMSGGMR